MVFGVPDGLWTGRREFGETMVRRWLAEVIRRKRLWTTELIGPHFV